MLAATRLQVLGPDAPRGRTGWPARTALTQRAVRLHGPWRAYGVAREIVAIHRFGVGIFGQEEDIAPVGTQRGGPGPPAVALPALRR